MAPRNYVNAGLAFIWIRLFVELWKMDKQLSVVSYLLLTGLGSWGGELWLHTVAEMVFLFPSCVKVAHWPFSPRASWQPRVKRQKWGIDQW